MNVIRKCCIKSFMFCLIFFMFSVSYADSITVPMKKLSADGVQQTIGTITATDTKNGLLLTPDVHHLTPGIHGFHVHVHPDCGASEKHGKEVAGLAAGGHFDLKNTQKHLGPYNDNGHLGDLPFLYADKDGCITHPVLAPRLTVKQIKSHTLMIHEGGDNYSDKPKPLGGGGARIACGIVR